MGKSVSKKARQAIFDKTAGRCWYCGVTLCAETHNDPDSYCIDHIVPMRHGGRTALSNLRASCRKCNGQKLSKSVEEYRAWIEWRSAGCEAFTENQTEWLSIHGIDLPHPPRHYFWGDNTSDDPDNPVRWRRQNHLWTDAEWEALARLAGAVRLLMPGVEIVGHQEIGRTATLCPGIEGDTLRAMIAEREG